MLSRREQRALLTVTGHLGPPGYLALEMPWLLLVAFRLARGQPSYTGAFSIIADGFRGAPLGLGGALARISTQPIKATLSQGFATSSR